MGNLLLSGVDVAEFCTSASEILQFVGWILTFVKISIPLVIIGLGIFDLGKAVVASKDDDVKKAAKTLGRRALAGVVIFFIPTIIMFLFGAISQFNKIAGEKAQAGFDVCEKCILTPWSNECTNAVTASTK